MSKSVWAAATVGFLLAGCSSGISDEALAGLPPKEAGKKVFEVRCKRCHMINGFGGVRGPNLSNVGGRMQESAIREFVKNPQAVRPGTPMPNLSLTDKQAEAVAAYLAELK